MDYDVPPERGNASKTHTPLLSTFRPEPSLPKEIPSNTHQADQSMASYDYIRDLRRCILEIDREKGLGFILSATGDFDHTITSVDKVNLTIFNRLTFGLFNRVQQQISLVYNYTMKSSKSMASMSEISNTNRSDEFRSNNPIHVCYSGSRDAHRCHANQ